MRFCWRLISARFCRLILLAAAGCSTAPRPASAPTISAPFVELTAPPRDRDTDCDGVADVDDACPAEPEDRDGFRDDDGCPDPDNDRDSLPDECDQCPDEPETYNGIVDEDGCPDVGRIIIQDSSIVILYHILFAPNSTQIQPKSRLILDEIGNVLRANPQIERIAALGNASTDEVGALRLSQRRAEAVRSALIALGIDPQRIEAHSYGSSRPVATGTRPEDRAKNRRTDFWILRANGHDLRTWNGKELIDVPQPLPSPIAPPAPQRPIEPCVPRAKPPLPSTPCRAEPRMAESAHESSGRRSSGSTSRNRVR